MGLVHRVSRKVGEQLTPVHYFDILRDQNWPRVRKKGGFFGLPWLLGRKKNRTNNQFSIHLSILSFLSKEGWRKRKDKNICFRRRIFGGYLTGTWVHASKSNYLGYQSLGGRKRFYHVHCLVNWMCDWSIGHLVSRALNSNPQFTLNWS